MLKRARASPWTQLHGRIADVDGGKFEVRRIEFVAALVERLVHQRGHQLDQSAHRIIGAVGIGDVARSCRRRPARRSASLAAPELDGVAERVDIARFAQDAVVESLAARGRPFQQLGAAVDRDAFLVTGDEKRDRTFGFAAVSGQMIERSRDLASDGALHVHGAAAVQHAVSDVGGKRRVRPRFGVAGRHNVGVAGEHQMRPARADPGVEVFDVGGAGLRERHPVHREARPLERRFQKAQRAAFGRRDRRAAQQILGDGDGIWRGVSCSGFIRP